MRQDVVAARRDRLRNGQVAAAVVLVVFAGLLVAGCRGRPGVAAYAADGFAVHESEVDDVIRDARDKAVTGESVPTGTQVVAVLVTREVARRSAAESRMAPVSAGAESAVWPDRFPPSSRYARALAEASAYVAGTRSAVRASGQSLEPDLATMNYDYLRARAAGAFIGDAVDFPETAYAIPDYVVNAVTRDWLLEAARRYDVVVNPRYRAASFPLQLVQSGQGSYTLVALPIDPEDVR